MPTQERGCATDTPDCPSAGLGLSTAFGQAERRDQSRERRASPVCSKYSTFRTWLPCESLTARLALGGDALLRVEELRLAGPGVEAQVAGSLGRAPSFAEAPFDLRIELEADPALRAALQGLGVPLRADGRGSLHVLGTAARPVVE